MERTVLLKRKGRENCDRLREKLINKKINEYLSITEVSYRYLYSKQIFFFFFIFLGSIAP